MHVKDGTVFANSRDVAAYFGKRHSNVLRDIDDLKCSDEFKEPNFELVYHEVRREGRGSFNVPTFDMTKDGFTFLVMGFTGREAARFKERYIQRFNEMEAALKAGPVLPDFTNPAIAARACLARDRYGFDFPSL